MIRQLIHIMITCAMLVFACLATGRQARVDFLEDHIEYLEEYIQENGLPTPALRIN